MTVTKVGLIAMLLLLTLAGRALAAQSASKQSGAWSDSDTWQDGHIPKAGDKVLIRAGHAVTYAAPSKPIFGNVTIDGKLLFAPEVSLELKVAGNIVVNGELQLRPANHQVQHMLTFHGIDERKYVGGCMDVMDSDVGLWVLGKGVLNANGSPKTSWTRLTGAARREQSTITVEDATGWQVGDRLEIVPTLSPDNDDSCWTGYDSVTITGIEGPQVSVSPSLKFDHPKVNKRWTAEVLNLTRNVVLQGTPEGRAHIMFMIDVPQTIKNIAIRHMGPRQQQKQGKFTEGVLGRYALHFHLCDEGSRGSLVEDVVVHDCGNHAFVPHGSHGITLRGCVSHNTFEDAFWWDPGAGNETHDTLWQRCLASRVLADPPFRGHRLTGFNLRHGDRNEVADCVAVGVQGSGDSAGFVWPEGAGRDDINAVWRFHDNLSHNNKCDGLFVWQNSGQLHLVEKFVTYHNHDNGIEHGAYSNSYYFREGVLYGNANAGLRLHAVSKDSRQLRFENLAIDGAGISRYAIEVVKHTPPPGQPTWIQGCSFQGFKEAAVAFTFDGKPSEAKKEWIDFVHCHFQKDARDFLFSKQVFTDSLITVEQEDGRVFELRRFDQSGVLVPEWNARQTVVREAGRQSAAPPGKPIRRSVSEDWTGSDATSLPATWSVETFVGQTPRVLIDHNQALVQSTGRSGAAVMFLPGQGAENVEQLVNLRISGNVPTAGLFARRSDDDPDTFYGVSVGVGKSDSLQIFKMLDGQATPLIATKQTLVDDVSYQMRFYVTTHGEGTDLKVKLWRADQKEPDAWTLQVLGDHARSLRRKTGRFGLWTQQGGNDARKVWYDNYHAEYARAGHLYMMYSAFQEWEMSRPHRQ